jgi:hypothetical protein
MEKECSTCQKGLKNTHWGIIALSVWLLASSVYGTIEIIKNVVNLLSH